MSISVIHPKTEEEYNKYFLLRWEILRKPWNQPKIIAPIEDDNSSIHFMAIDEKNNALAVCRLHFNNPKVAQCRFVAVSKNAQGKGVGKQIMLAAEIYAKENGADLMMLHARDNAVGFYKYLNYTVVESSYLLFDEIKHYLMNKELI